MYITSVTLYSRLIFKAIRLKKVMSQLVTEDCYHTHRCMLSSICFLKCIHSTNMKLKYNRYSGFCIIQH